MSRILMNFISVFISDFIFSCFKPRQKNFYVYWMQSENKLKSDSSYLNIISYFLYQSILYLFRYLDELFLYELYIGVCSLSDIYCNETNFGTLRLVTVLDKLIIVYLLIIVFCISKLFEIKSKINDKDGERRLTLDCDVR